MKKFKEKLVKRQSSIDFIKFFLSIIIIFLHFEFIFSGGYLAVEGFFMISGFLMMRSLCKKQDTSPEGTMRFVLHKYKAIFLPLLFSAISGFLIYEFLIFKDTYDIILRRIPLLLYEIVPLQVAGFEAMYTTGVSWYLAAMLLAIALIHPFAKKDPQRFAYTVCPTAAVLIYGFLCARCGNLSIPNTWLLEGLLNTGLLRGIAGIASGCFLYVLVSRTFDKKAPSIKERCLFTLLEILGWAFILLLMTNKHFVCTSMDYVFLPIMFGVLYIAFSQKSIFALFINHKWTGILSACSIYTFMNHLAWSQYFKYTYPDKTKFELLPWYILCVIVSSVCVWLLTKLTELILRKIKERRKKEIQSV
ncbi:MAG: acyltransferase family protein [Clostridia bacterium]|nr:acyltransferase family protein [Clostridia bacterium]